MAEQTRPAAQDRRAAKKFLDNTSPNRWIGLVDKAKSPVFVNAIMRNPTADAKLKAHVQALHQHANAPTIRTVKGERGGEYDIRQLGDGRRSCSCRDCIIQRTTDPTYKC